QQVEQRGLARPGGPHEREEVAAGNVEVDTTKYVDPFTPAGIELVQVRDTHERTGIGHHGTTTSAPSARSAGALITTRSPGVSPASTSTRSPSSPPVAMARRS